MFWINKFLKIYESADVLVYSEIEHRVYTKLLFLLYACHSGKWFI